MTFAELDLAIEDLKEFVGARIDEIIYSNNRLYLVLNFHKQQIILIADVAGRKPALLYTTEHYQLPKKQVKPLLLFLNANFKGLIFEGALRHKEYGRWVTLSFGGREKAELDLHLFPQARNIIARIGDSQLSLNKVGETNKIADKVSFQQPRPMKQIFTEWKEMMVSGKVAAPADPGAKALAKKIQGLAGMRTKLEELQKAPWRAVGDWLSTHREFDGLPKEFLPHVDIKADVQDNIDVLFTKAKQAKAKAASIEERIVELSREIEKLQKSPAGPAGKKAAVASPLVNAKGRTKVFPDGITAYVGKSAADNLKILRQAKAWYLWVHVKDMPSSHGVIAMGKNAKVPDSVLRQTALWVLKESLTPKQWKDWQGLKCQFICCECRHVTPIKGDKLGRVHYKNERVMTLLVQDIDQGGV